MAEKWKAKNRYIYTVDGGFVTEMTSTTVAAQTVQEHNAHEGLVEALYAFVGLREVQQRRESGEFHITGDTFMKIWDELTVKGKAALALAEAKP